MLSVEVGTAVVSNMHDMPWDKFALVPFRLIWLKAALLLLMLLLLAADAPHAADVCLCVSGV